MKKELLIFCLFLISHLSIAQSQCGDFLISFSKADSINLKDVPEGLNVDMSIDFDQNKYSKAYIEVYQTMGIRPVAAKQFQINKPSSVTFPVHSYRNSSTEQYLIIWISDKPREENAYFTKQYKCLDSIRISDAYSKQDHFWKKGVVVDYQVFVNDKQIDTLSNKINIVGSSADFTSKSKILLSRESFSVGFKIKESKETYEFCIWSDLLKSNHENLEIIIYPNAFKKIRNKTGLRYFTQLEKLTYKERLKYIQMFPEYAVIFDSNINFRVFYMYDTEHIIIYRISDSSGVYFIGADCSK